MRTFNQLMALEQAAAVEYTLTCLLRAILERGLRFDDATYGNNLQASIDQAFAEAERMQTPWFAGEYIMEAVGDDLKSIALCDAEDTRYGADDDGLIARLRGTLKGGFKVVDA